MGDRLRRRLVRRDDHAGSDLSGPEQLLGEPVRQADATMGRAVTREQTLMQGDARPSEALHERHLGVIVEVRVVLDLALDDRKDAFRRVVAALAGRDLGARDHSVAVEDANFLAPERDDTDQGTVGVERLKVGAVVAVWVRARRLVLERLGERRGRCGQTSDYGEQCHQRSASNQGAKRPDQRAMPVSRSGSHGRCSLARAIGDSPSTIRRLD